MTTTPNTSERRFTIHYGFALLAVFAALGTLFPSIFMFIGGANGGSGLLVFFALCWLAWGGMWTIVWAAFATQHTLASSKKSAR